MKLPQSYFYIDKGIGGRRCPGRHLGGASRVGWHLERGTVLTSENMATVQIVNVREHSATALITNVKYATFPVGTPVVQVAKLPQ